MPNSDTEWWKFLLGQNKEVVLFSHTEAISGYIIRNGCLRNFDPKTIRGKVSQMPSNSRQPRNISEPLHWRRKSLWDESAEKKSELQSILCGSVASKPDSQILDYHEAILQCFPQKVYVDPVSSLLSNASAPATLEPFVETGAQRPSRGAAMPLGPFQLRFHNAYHEKLVNRVMCFLAFRCSQPASFFLFLRGFFFYLVFLRSCDDLV